LTEVHRLEIEAVDIFLYLAQHGVQEAEEMARFYLDAIDFRAPSADHYQVSTDCTGFSTEESYETMGQQLALPPAFAPMREKIEPMLLPLDTSFERVTTEYGEEVPEPAKV